MRCFFRRRVCENVLVPYFPDRPQRVVVDNESPFSDLPFCVLSFQNKCNSVFLLPPTRRVPRGQGLVRRAAVVYGRPRVR